MKPKITDYEWEFTILDASNEVVDRLFFISLKDVTSKDLEIAPIDNGIVLKVHYDGDDYPSDEVYADSDWKLDTEDSYGNSIPRRFQSELDEFIKWYNENKKL